MIGEIHQILIGLHIFLAIIWVGGILFIGWGVFPAVKAMKPNEQRLFLHTLMLRTHWIFTLAGAGVIITGFLLGTVVGPITHISDIFRFAYGISWFIAFLIGLITLAWGIFVGYNQTMKVLSEDSLWFSAENGDALPLNKAMVKITCLESVEVIGFIVILICMVLLR
ncbi:MAG: hypothetical protein Q8934_09830 [Bacillota bacterium]|nr:hypothetical protein [Bacillota bacterium]